jgi:uncharacterized membrane protein
MADSSRLGEVDDRSQPSSAGAKVSPVAEGREPVAGRQRRKPSKPALIRVTVAFALGLVAGAAVGLSAATWQVAVLSGWIVAAGVTLAWVWVSIHGLDGEHTAAIATAEDDSRLAADLLLVSASGASLIGVAFALVSASGEEGMTKALTTVAATASIVVSWALVQTVYTLRYAHLYYGTVRGIHFEGEDQPDYRDFAYLAFTIGMTYQVSDTTLTARPIRRVALRHALLSWVFGTAVVAMTINVVASLFSRR